jgi:hypothetical protein
MQIIACCIHYTCPLNLSEKVSIGQSHDPLCLATKTSGLQASITMGLLLAKNTLDPKCKWFEVLQKKCKVNDFDIVQNGK